MNGENGAKLKSFCTEALQMLGASVSCDADGLLSVGIPPSMLDLFEGRDSLRLAFTPEEADDDVDLVVPGCYVLERLLETLRLRGETASISLEPSASVVSSPGLELANAEARLVSSETQWRDVLVSVFRISTVSDEDVDRLVRVAVDCVTGEPSPVGIESILSASATACPAPLGVDADALAMASARAQSTAMDHARSWSDSVQHSIDSRMQKEIERLEQYYKDVLSESAKGSTSKEVRRSQKARDRAAAAYDDADRTYLEAKGLLQAANDVDSVARASDARLRPLYKQRSKLSGGWSSSASYSQLAACEREIAILANGREIACRMLKDFESENMMAKLEAERTKKLDKLRKRLAALDAPPLDPDAAAELEQLRTQLDDEKAQRIAELHEKFQLKVVVAPVSVSFVRYPLAELNYAAVCGSDSVLFSSRQDLVTGQTYGPMCQSCRGQMPTGYACSCGHLVCPSCHVTCTGCGKDLCSKCVSGACQICGGVVCDSCRATCDVCGRLVCPAHSVRCNVCGKSLCVEHSASCAMCGQRACVGCVDGEGYCRTCLGLFPASSSRCAIAELLPECSECGLWLLGEARDSFVLVRPGLRLRAYVVDKTTGRLRSERVMGIRASITAMLHLP